MTIETPPRQIHVKRPPVNREELHAYVQMMWGVTIPRMKVCPDHVSPFDAFCEGYFGNSTNWVLWYGSRGTGKSLMLALLALTKATALEINVVLLGGSMAQSNNVHEHVTNLLMHTNAPLYAIERQIKTELTFHAGNWVRPIPASQKTVRGPHPQMTLLDEIDEMERPIYDAAMGQALEKANQRGYTLQEMVVASSTWQNPVGTFSSVRDEALVKGQPIRTWCWREVLKTAENPEGWMDPEFIERKKSSVPIEMFRVEYELGEPAGDARAFDLTKLNEACVEMEPVDETHKGNDDTWVYALPEVTATYAAGADWAKEKDMTVIVVVRTDVTPYRVVYLRRMNRKPWPEMIEGFNKVTTDYSAVSAHDGTGIGNVVNDMIDERTHKVVMVGRDRTLLLTEYVAAVEGMQYVLPRNTPLHMAHKAATVDDLYATGLGRKYHLPDDVAAMAICHRAVARQAPPASPGTVKKTDFHPRSLAPLRADTDEPFGDSTRDGEVHVKDEAETTVFWL
jgi:hypothetical protein